MGKEGPIINREGALLKRVNRKVTFLAIMDQQTMTGFETGQ